MPLVKDHPLVSFCLFAFNQAEFIRGAVEAAFSQSYEPLEIILSDDCSSDETFQIMRELVAGYRGPHHVILNRNATNLGLGGPINVVASLAHGAWMVSAAGDDLSSPDRVSRLMQAANQCPDAYGILSAWDVMDAHGVPTLVNQNNLPSGRIRGHDHNMIDQSLKMRGAVASWRRDLFTGFGPLQPDVWREDVVLAFRALLSGSIQVVPESLVQYRSHGNSISAGVTTVSHGVLAGVRQREAQQARWARLLHSALCQMKSDYDVFVARRDVVALEQREWDAQLTARIWMSQCQAEWWQLRWRQQMERLRLSLQGPCPSPEMRRWMLVRSGGMVLFVACCLAMRLFHRLYRKGFG